MPKTKRVVRKVVKTKTKTRMKQKQKQTVNIRIGGSGSAQPSYNPVLPIYYMTNGLGGYTERLNGIENRLGALALDKSQQKIQQSPSQTIMNNTNQPAPLGTTSQSEPLAPMGTSSSQPTGPSPSPKLNDDVFDNPPLGTASGDEPLKPINTKQFRGSQAKKLKKIEQDISLGKYKDAQTKFGSIIPEYLSQNAIVKYNNIEKSLKQKYDMLQ